jgi:hypothetical protein
MGAVKHVCAVCAVVCSCQMHVHARIDVVLFALLCRQRRRPRPRKGQRQGQGRGWSWRRQQAQLRAEAGGHDGEVQPEYMLVAVVYVSIAHACDERHVSRCYTMMTYSLQTPVPRDPTVGPCILCCMMQLASLAGLLDAAGWQPAGVLQDEHLHPCKHSVTTPLLLPAVLGCKSSTT